MRTEGHWKSAGFAGAKFGGTEVKFGGTEFGGTEFGGTEYDAGFQAGLLALHAESGIAAGGIAEREGLAHDACNLLAAVGLYCDLMSRPGVMNLQYQHYLDEMRRLAQRSEGLIERMMPRAVSGEAIWMKRAKSSVSRLEDPELRVLRELQALEKAEVESAAAGPAVSLVAAGAEEEVAKLHGVEAAKLRGAEVAKRPGVEVAKLIAESREMLQLLSGPLVQLEIESLLPAEVRLEIDEEAMLRVLLNLTVNARDAMPEGGRLRITAQWDVNEFGDEFGRTVLISVQDSGVGMPARMVAALNHGMAANENQNVDATGRVHGLGLKIVRELVAEAGGRMKVLSSAAGDVLKDRNTLRTGTRFEMALPVWRNVENQANCVVRKNAGVAAPQSAERRQHSRKAGKLSAAAGPATAAPAAVMMAEQNENGRATMAGTRRLQLVSPRSNARPETSGRQTAANAAQARAERGTATC